MIDATEPSPAPVLWPPELTLEYLRRKVAESLDEDLGTDRRDLTTEAVVPAGHHGRAVLVAKADGVLAGMVVAEEVFRQVDSTLAVRALIRDGSPLEPGRVIADVRGPLRSLLSAERTALNFLQQLSGVATLTNCCVQAAAQSGAAVILDTRKTVPGLRPLQRYAVQAGGGTNHRFNLAAGILVKDNHVAAAGSVAAAVEAARAAGLPVEVEICSLAELREALATGADAVLLDNMSPSQAAEAVALVAGRVSVEGSGGVTLANLGEYAAAGVDRISIGALTHSAPALDVSMEVLQTWPR